MQEASAASAASHLEDVAEGAIERCRQQVHRGIGNDSPSPGGGGGTAITHVLVVLYEN